MIVKYIFTLIGAALLIGALLMYNSTQDFLDRAVITEGTVIDLIRSQSEDSDTYTPFVKFRTKNGEIVEFVSSTGGGPNSYSIGEVVSVAYLEDSIDKAEINDTSSLWGGVMILAGMGSVFFLIGLSIILFGASKNKKVKYLKEKGTPVVAKFQSVEVNPRIEFNGKNPYQICAQWINPATSKLHIFNSDNIWFDPTNHIDREEITVLIEEGNPSKYHVDISFLPRNAS